MNDSLAIVGEQHLEWMRYRDEFESHLAGDSEGRSLLIPLSARRLLSSGGDIGNEDREDVTTSLSVSAAASNFHFDSVAALVLCSALLKRDDAVLLGDQQHGSQGSGGAVIGAEDYEVILGDTVLLSAFILTPLPTTGR